jgi:RHS repeat-associated protein
VLAILDGSNAVKEFYTHGPDLSGAVGGAGGIGGILAVKYPQQTNAPTYFLHPDAMGNVILATDSQGKEAGRYQYSAFGRLITSSGSFLPRTLSFSKENDQETGLVMFGYRHLNPTLGRWIERDRIFEQGGINLYRAMENSPLRAIDPAGLEVIFLDPDLSGFPPEVHDDAVAIAQKLQDAWEKILLGKGTAGMQSIAKCLAETKDITIKVQVRKTDALGRTYPGTYPNPPVIEIGISDPLNPVHTLVHEIIHAIETIEVRDAQRRQSCECLQNQSVQRVLKALRGVTKSGRVEIGTGDTIIGTTQAADAIARKLLGQME